MLETTSIARQDVLVRSGDVSLPGYLWVPDAARGLVLFVHGSGSSRRSPRNQAVAGSLNESGLATLLFDLLTEEEGRVDDLTRELRFDIGLLAERTVGALDWVAERQRTRDLPDVPDLSELGVGLFGSSTGAAAALIAAAERPRHVRAVVSRGGRPDLAADWLPKVEAPTLLVVGGYDVPVIGMNERARDAMNAPVRLQIVPAATHLFEEPGKLDQVARLTAEFFREHLAGEAGRSAS